MVEGTGLENRRTGNGTVSSNLTLSVRCTAVKSTSGALGSPSENAHASAENPRCWMGGRVV